MIQLRTHEERGRDNKKKKRQNKGEHDEGMGWEDRRYFRRGMCRVKSEGMYGQGQSYTYIYTHMHTHAHTHKQTPTNRRNRH